MKITYVGHSCFLVEDEGASIVFDPYKEGSVPGYEAMNIEASQISCSHQHGDHYGKDEVKVVEAKSQFDVSIINTYHDEVKGAKRGPNNITIIRRNGIKIVHMGDLGCDISDEELEMLKDTDILMIPVGGFYTIDHKEAYEISSKINPKAIIPMHYRGDGFGYNEIGALDNFISIYEGKREIINKDSVVETDEIRDGIIVIMKALRRA